MKLSLLDVMALQSGCMYLSDLRRMSNFQKRYLAQDLKDVEANDASLSEWNDALEYITGKKAPRSCAEEAKTALIAALTGNCTESQAAR